MEAALNNNHDDTAPVATESVALVVDSLMQYPIDAIKRTHRETLLDSCLLLDARGGHASVRPLLHKLWRVGNATSQLTRSVDVFRTLFQHSGADATARRILQHAVANKDQDKIKSFLEDIINASWESSGKAAKNSAQHLAFSWTVVTELWAVLEDEDGAAMTILKQTRNNLLKILDHHLTDITTDMTLQLQMWRKLWSLERDDRESAQNMAARVTKSLVSQQPPLGGDIEFVVEGLELVFTVAESIKGVLAAAALLIVPLEHFPHASHDRILSPYRSFLSRLEPSVHNYSLGCVGDDCLSGKLGPVGWELLKAHVDTIPGMPFLVLCYLLCPSS